MGNNPSSDNHVIEPSTKNIHDNLREFGVLKKYKVIDGENSSIHSASFNEASPNIQKKSTRYEVL